MKQKILKKEYKGIGFVEALIALTVSGIVAIVLMSISAEAIGELRKLDIQDSIAQHAVSTAVHVQNLAIEQAVDNPEGNIFLDLQTNRCYKFNPVNGSLNTAEAIPVVSSTRNDFFPSLVSPDSEYFRVMCVQHFSAVGDGRKILVKIIVGSTKVAGQATTDTDIKDYEHFAIINL
ncbi:MAG: hypothetical protein UR61_C0001G0007 [candidate division WS6 bacterium GW2011_GWE1_34_7]|uniref:Uncharacterized protein n=1 Tax=candidate division WS6 bacterium GW2011_GWE1_34_7 TaxID=1619093 RepID=A0A0G0BAA7_9BACT|nr:MAG: hypothetical protein UR61_C0001G0007 [candidate division WS6 bacterium GW2011_GWE1_34_7]